MMWGQSPNPATGGWDMLLDNYRFHVNLIGNSPIGNSPIGNSLIGCSPIGNSLIGNSPIGNISMLFTF